MDLIPVKSSNIAAIGYSAECRLMRVLYRDGRMYDHVDVDPIEHETAMAVDSKGQYIAVLAKRKPGVRIGGEPIKLREPARRVIQTHDPDPCCSAGITRALPLLTEVDRWECPKCGGDWRMHLVNGVRHWARFEMIEVI